MGEAKRRRDAGLGRPAFDMQAARNALSGAVRASRGITSTTPLLPLSERVRVLCAGVSLHAPVMLSFTDAGHGYRPGFCHTNVQHCARENGGEALGGWLVWENPGWAELEAHAVWRSPSGQLVDVTPRRDGESLILFLPDPAVKSTVRVDGQIIPANRTSIPGCPYLAASRPVPSSMVEAVYDAPTRKEMQRLGVLPP